MPTLTYSYTFAPAGLIKSSEVNANFNSIAALVNGLLDATNLANAAVTENKLANLSVSTGKIQDLAVTNAKVAAGVDAVKIGTGVVSNTEFGYLDGVSSAIQTQLNAKQATLTGAATTIASADLTASRALVSDVSGKVAVSAVTAVELGYLTGVSSAIQTQLAARALTSTTISAGTGLTGGGSLAADRTISHAAHTGDVTGDSALTIASNAVTTAKINDAAVTTAKINDAAVTAAKIDLTSLVQSGSVVRAFYLIAPQDPSLLVLPAGWSATTVTGGVRITHNLNTASGWRVAVLPVGNSGSADNADYFVVKYDTLDRFIIRQYTSAGATRTPDTIGCWVIAYS